VHVGHLAHEHRPGALRERHVEGATAREAVRCLLDPCLDERLGMLGPGEAYLDLLE